MRSTNIMPSVRQRAINEVLDYHQNMNSVVFNRSARSVAVSNQPSGQVDPTQNDIIVEGTIRDRIQTIQSNIQKLNQTITYGSDVKAPTPVLSGGAPKSKRVSKKQQQYKAATSRAETNVGITEPSPDIKPIKDVARVVEAPRVEVVRDDRAKDSEFVRDDSRDEADSRYKAQQELLASQVKPYQRFPADAPLTPKQIKANKQEKSTQLARWHKATLARIKVETDKAKAELERHRSDTLKSLKRRGTKINEDAYNQETADRATEIDRSIRSKASKRLAKLEELWDTDQDQAIAKIIKDIGPAVEPHSTYMNIADEELGPSDPYGDAEHARLWGRTTPQYNPYSVEAQPSYEPDMSDMYDTDPRLRMAVDIPPVVPVAPVKKGKKTKKGVPVPEAPVTEAPAPAPGWRDRFKSSISSGLSGITNLISRQPTPVVEPVQPVQPVEEPEVIDEGDAIYDTSIQPRVPRRSFLQPNQPYTMYIDDLGSQQANRSDDGGDGGDDVGQSGTVVQSIKVDAKIKSLIDNSLASILSGYNSLVDYVALQQRQQSFSSKDTQVVSGLLQTLVDPLKQVIASAFRLQVDPSGEKIPEGQIEYTRIYNVLQNIINKIQSSTNGGPLLKADVGLLTAHTPIREDIISQPGFDAFSEGNYNYLDTIYQRIKKEEDKLKSFLGKEDDNGTYIPANLSQIERDGINLKLNQLAQVSDKISKAGYPINKKNFVDEATKLINRIGRQKSAIQIREVEPYTPETISELERLRQEKEKATRQSKRVTDTQLKQKIEADKAAEAKSGNGRSGGGNDFGDGGDLAPYLTKYLMPKLGGQRVQERKGKGEPMKQYQKGAIVKQPSEMSKERIERKPKNKAPFEMRKEQDLWFM